MKKSEHHLRRRLVMPFAVLIVLQLVFGALLFLPEGGDLPQAKEGMIDLSAWDERGGDVVRLEGEWPLYWGKFLTYSDFSGQQNPPQGPDLFADVPDEWNGFVIDGERLFGAGYGTYRLTVQVREAGVELALKAMPLSTAYALYIDDELLLSNGRLGTDPNAHSEEGMPRTVRFMAPAERFDLIVHVSNYDYAKGGMNRPLFLGTPEAMERNERELLTKDLLLLGGLLIACFYSFSMYVMNRDEKISLFFGLVCFIFVLRIPLTGAYLIYDWIPWANLKLSEWINYATFHAGVLFYALFIREFFPDLFSERVRKLLLGLTAVIFVLLLVLPLRVYSEFYLLSDALGLAVLVYPCYVIIKAAVNRKAYSWLIFTGNALLLTMVIVDIINTELNRLEMSYFSKFGIFLFLVLHAYILARRFTKSFKDSMSLSRKLMELDTMKDEFLANTSHELRTPLHGIIGITESLIAGAEGPLNRMQQHNLQLVASSGRRLTHLINDILDFSKLRHKDIELYQKNVQLQPLADFVLTMCRQMSPGKPIEWKMSIPDGLPPVFADENRLVQILYNLVGNAAKFTEQGEIEISASENEGQVALSVSDTGIGIEPDHLNHIFDPFTQADASTVRTYGGAGLGLSITKHLVDLHGGRIEVSSTPGAGSRFTIVLPAGQPEEDPAHADMFEDDWSLLPIAEQAASVQSPAPELFTASKQQVDHILIVDDDPANLQSAFNLLKLEGYSVTAAASGQEALELLRSHPDIRLAVLDVMMPGMSGYEVCRTIRETKSGAELPVLLVTAKHRMEDLLLGFQSGANDYLVKPYEPLEYKARVRTLLELNASVRKALKSEAAFLQAQMKPHFIYNTLNTISYFCLRDGEKANSLLENFSDYLRASFDFKHMEDLVPLAKELDFVNTYVEIEKARFGDRLQTVFDVDERLKHIRIPPLILQPLVENAIIHGAMKKLEGGVVRLMVERIDTRIIFTVSDTGVGIPKARLSGLLEEHSKTRGVGLRNIHKRLKSHCGTGLSINSVEGQGTEVQFVIPEPLT